MFSSNRVVAKNSLAYKAWLAGISRKQLKRHDLDVDVELLVDAVQMMGTNFSTIGLCTLGIVRIHHGKTTVLLNDCERASELASHINIHQKMKIHVSKREEIVEIPAIPDLESLPLSFTQESLYLPDAALEIPTRFPAEITLREELPNNTQFTISNYEDFGNEGIFDTNMDTGSQFINNLLAEGMEPKSDAGDSADFEPFYGTATDIDDYPKVGEIEAARDVPVYCEKIEAGENNDTILEESFESSKFEEIEEKDHSMMELESLRSYASSTATRRSGRRKRRSIFDDVTIIGQTEIRENINDYSDTINTTIENAPPTRKLMRIRENGTCESLLTSCHVIGVRSKKGPISQHISWICNRAMNRKTRFSEDGVPEELDEIFRHIVVAEHAENPRNEEIEEWLNNENQIEGREHVEQVEYAQNGGLEQKEEENVENEVMEPKEEGNEANFENFEIMEPPIVNFEENLEDIEPPVKRKRKNLDDGMEKENNNNDEPIMKIKRHHKLFLKKLEMLEERNEEITLTDVLEVIFSKIDTKTAAGGFMTILELKKCQKLDVEQLEAFGPIFLKISG